MEEVSRIDKTNLTQLSFLILLYLLVTWGSQQQNKVKNNLKHEREKWTTGEEGHRRKDNTIHKNKKNSGSGGSRGREIAKPRRRRK